MAFCESCKTIGSIERTPEAVDHGVLKMRCIYVKQCRDTVGWFVNFADCFVKYLFLFPLVQRV